MADLHWWEDFTDDNDCLPATEWNDFIDYIQHSGCTDFTIYATCTDTGQAFRFTKNNAISYIYGGSTTGDDLFIYGNDTDIYPFIALYGNTEIHLEVNEGEEIYFKNGGLQFFLFDYNSAQSFLYGGENASDDLLIYANSSNTYPYIEMIGGDALNFNVGNNVEITFKEGGRQFFFFDSNLTDSLLYGGSTTSDDLKIYANTVNSFPFINLLGGAGLNFEVGNDQEIRFKEDGRQFFLFDNSLSDSLLYGGATSSDDLKIYANSTDLCAGLELFGNGDLRALINLGSKFEISTCSDESLFEVHSEQSDRNKYIDHHCLQCKNFVLELRITDPSSPTCTGQIWFRTDLV